MVAPLSVAASATFSLSSARVYRTPGTPLFEDVLLAWSLSSCSTMAVSAPASPGALLTSSPLTHSLPPSTLQTRSLLPLILKAALLAHDLPASKGRAGPFQIRGSDSRPHPAFLTAAFLTPKTMLFQTFSSIPATPLLVPTYVCSALGFLRRPLLPTCPSPAWCSVLASLLLRKMANSYCTFSSPEYASDLLSLGYGKVPSIPTCPD